MQLYLALKEKGISKANIFEAGLLALENGSSEEQLFKTVKSVMT